MTSRQTFAIAGAGLAGAKAAETLRAEGFDGRVILLGAEDHRPYERPPLSKDYLQGRATREDLAVHDADFYARHDIELRTATTVTALDVRRRELLLEDGERLGFDALLLATGAEPRRLPVPGGALDGVLHLRDVGDADVLRARAAEAGHAVVVGAGWIGAETAASLRQLGVAVTLVEPAAVPLERVLGPQVGAIYRDLHRDHGVELLLGTGVEAIEGAGRAERVVTTGGRRIECDLVVAGVGVAARTGLAARAGLEIAGGGVAVDEHLRSSVPHVLAAGDVAAAQHPHYGRRLRVEHWDTALHQGEAAGRSMLGTGDPYDRIPYFYSDQYDVSMEYLGHAGPDDEVVLRGSAAARELVAFWLSGRRVTAAMAMNVWDVAEPLRALIAGRVPVDPDELRDPHVPLEALTGAAQR